MLIEVIAVVSLLIASKFEETKPPRLSDLLKCVNLQETPQVALDIERVIYRDILQWRLSILTPYRAMEMIIGYWDLIIFNETSSPR